MRRIGVDDLPQQQFRSNRYDFCLHFLSFQTRLFGLFFKGTAILYRSCSRLSSERTCGRVPFSATGQFCNRHFVFSIPKILRRYFLYDPRLLADLSRCAWESLKVFMREAVPENDPIPGAVIAVQTFGDFLGFNPHLHILMTDGCFYGSRGMFRVSPPFELKKLEALFRHKIFQARRQPTYHTQPYRRPRFSMEYIP